MDAKVVSLPDDANVYRVPTARYVHYAEFRYYYAYGNTVSENFLLSVDPRINTNPSVLVLGCGDLRSCLNTIWNNLDPSTRPSNDHFRSVEFNLNDYSPAILARNILFIYLLKIAPQADDLSSGALSKWISALWSIWYCHELLPDHYKVYKEALEALITFADDWNSTSNPLSSFVFFASHSALDKVCASWKLWLQSAKDNRVDWMNKERKKITALGIATKEKSNFLFTIVIKFLGLHLFHPEESRHVKKMAKECEGYFETGNAYAETVFGISIADHKKIVNSSFFEDNHSYTLHYGSVPFKCYNVSKLTHSALIKHGIPDGAIITQQASEAQPLLSNCVQQFSVWVMFTAKVLKAEASGGVTFILDCSDAIDYSLKLQNKKKQFDVISTSNLIDPLSLPAVIFSCMPLLKQSARLLTTSILSSFFTSSFEAFVEAVFGIPANILPSLFGIRCVSLDDIDKFTSSIEMLSLVIANSKRGDSICMIWEKLPTSTVPICVQSYHANLMYKFVKTSLLSFLESVEDSSGLVCKLPLCSQTVVEALACIAGRIDNHVEFLDSVCCLIHKDQILQPFLMTLQTLALLSGLHLHLTISTKDCPLCNDVDLSNFLSRVTISIDTMMDKQNKGSPFFVLYLHESDLDFNLLSCFNLSLDGNVHVIDSFICSVSSESNIDITFFLPQSMTCMSGYQISVARYLMMGSKSEFAFSLGNIISKIEIDQLHPQQINLTASSCHYDRMNRLKETLALGKVVRNEKGESSFLTIVAVNDEVLSSGRPFTTQQFSSYGFKVVCGKYEISLTFQDPVSYMMIKLKISRRNKQIEITVPFGQCHFYNDRALAFRNPDNELMFQTSDVNAFYGFKTSLPKGSPMIEVLTTISDIFLTPTHHVQLLTGKKVISGFLIRHRSVYDVQSGLPAVDVSFIFAEDGSFELPREVMMLWFERLHEKEHYPMSITLKDEEYPILKKVFGFFQRQTLGQQTSMEVGKLSKYLNRALIYSLLTVDSVICPKNIDVLRHIFPTTQDSSPLLKCSACGSETKQNISCGCGKVQYCTKECQMAHWNTHKYMCTCTYCKKTYWDLKRCGRCMSVAYCSEECQRRDWAKHKGQCKK